jgi:two-component system sensor histidine kinase/response regulator
MSLVIVVDDDRDMRCLYTDILEGLGLDVVCARDGVEALRLAVELKPELVFTDWHMPRMDGIELCEALRSQAQLSHTRLILHSSDVITEPWHADVCLRKACSLERIELAVNALLAGGEGRADYRSRHQALEQSWASAG